VDLKDATLMILTESGGHPGLERLAQSAYDELASGREVSYLILGDMINEASGKGVLRALHQKYSRRPTTPCSCRYSKRSAATSQSRRDAAPCRVTAAPTRSPQTSATSGDTGAHHRFQAARIIRWYLRASAPATR
jgi:hypothetical protein